MHITQKTTIFVASNLSQVMETTITEDPIVRQLREGHEAAYKYLFDHHYAVLCHMAETYVHDQFLAETIVGDIIFHLWEIRDHLDIHTSLRSYLARSVRNRCLDYLKSQAQQHEVAVSSAGLNDFPVLQYVRSDDYPLGRLLRDELENEIRHAIERLPDECRRVFKLSRFEGKKYAEIAKELSISVNTVKYHVKHALALLQKDLGKYLTAAILLLLEGQ